MRKNDGKTDLGPVEDWFFVWAPRLMFVAAMVLLFLARVAQ